MLYASLAKKMFCLVLARLVHFKLLNSSIVLCIVLCDIIPGGQNLSEFAFEQFKV